jgi:hypothetical protein
MPNDYQYLLHAADGPESISIFVSEHRGIVDWCSARKAVYLPASINGASIELGPFHLGSIYQQLQEQLKPNAATDHQEPPAAVSPDDPTPPWA